MGIGREMIAEYMFEYYMEELEALSEGLWTTKEGESIYLEDMSYTHLQNAMSMVGITSPWYSKFKEELSRRDKIIYESLKSSYYNIPENWKKGI